jgi:hypothetical protein
LLLPPQHISNYTQANMTQGGVKGQLNREPGTIAALGLFIIIHLYC